MTTAACPVCDRPLRIRCPGCGYHPDSVAAELLTVARRLIARLEDLPAGHRHRPYLYEQILRAAKLAGRAELQATMPAHTLEVPHA